MLYIEIPRYEREVVLESGEIKKHLIGPFKLQMEHSLVSISKWESIWEVPFFLDEKKTPEQLMSYIECMTITQNVDQVAYQLLTEENMKLINAYISKGHSATTISEGLKNTIKNEIITSELVYYWMVAHRIPFESQKWHIRRLLNLIRICNIKNDPNSKKLTKAEAINRNREINEMNRQKYKTKG